MRFPLAVFAGLIGSWVLAPAAAQPVHAARQAAALEGTVSRVVDGDTLWFAVPGKAPIVVRLRDIDAPEICQPWGEQSRAALAELALNKTATLRPAARDPHGRTVGTVLVDDVDVGRRMVEEGQAWSTRTRYDQGPLVKQERMAKALARGFHAQAGNVLPAEFRRANGPCVEGQAPASVPAAAAAATHSPPQRPSTTASAFRCDGRTHCSQMTSCAEAKYFLAHCPGVRMDGNGDGVPCESQWCGGSSYGRDAGRRSGR